MEDADGNVSALPVAQFLAAVAEATFPVIEPQPVWAGAVRFDNIEVAVSVEIGQSHVECDVRAQSLARIDKSAFPVIKPNLVRLSFRGVAKIGIQIAIAVQITQREGERLQRPLEDLPERKFTFALSEPNFVPEISQKGVQVAVSVEVAERNIPACGVGSTNSPAALLKNSVAVVEPDPGSSRSNRHRIQIPVTIK